MKKVFYSRQNAHLQTCFDKLFGVDELMIQEDFLQISELVNTESHFMNRSTTDTDLIDYLPWDEENELYLIHEPLVTEYLGSLAFLSEKFSAVGRSILSIYHDMVFETGYNFLLDRQFWYPPRKRDFWILGASHNYTLRIDAKNDLKCDAHSCYEETLKSGNICKPGIFFMFCYQVYQ